MPIAWSSTTRRASSIASARSHWHRVTARAARRSDDLSRRSAAGTVSCPRADQRRAAFQRSRRHVERRRLQRRQLDEARLRRRRHAVGRDLHVSRRRPKSSFPTACRLQMDIRLFRTTKEDMNKPILGSLVVRNPITGLASAPRNFAAREYFTLDQFIPRKLTDADGQADRSVPRSGRRRSRRAGTAVHSAVAVLRRRAGRRLPAGSRRTVRRQLRQGLRRHLAADGADGRDRRRLEHVPQRSGGDAGDGGDRGRRRCCKPFLVDVVRDNLFEGRARTGGVLESIVRLTKQQAVTLELEEGTTTDRHSIDRQGAEHVRRAAA